ncbi:hypothetical protein ACQ4PT_007858 [Festuca glaucescens]
MRPTRRSSARDIVSRRTVQGLEAPLNPPSYAALSLGVRTSAGRCPRSRGCRRAAQQPWFACGWLTGTVKDVDLELCMVVGRRSQATQETSGAEQSSLQFLVLAELIIYRGYLDLPFHSGCWVWVGYRTARRVAAPAPTSYCNQGSDVVQTGTLACLRHLGLDDGGSSSVFGSGTRCVCGHGGHRANSDIGRRLKVLGDGSGIRSGGRTAGLRLPLHASVPSESLTVFARVAGNTPSVSALAALWPPLFRGLFLPSLLLPCTPNSSSSSHARLQP